MRTLPHWRRCADSDEAVSFAQSSAQSACVTDYEFDRTVAEGESSARGSFGEVTALGRNDRV